MSLEQWFTRGQITRVAHGAQEEAELAFFFLGRSGEWPQAPAPSKLPCRGLHERPGIRTKSYTHAPAFFFYCLNEKHQPARSPLSLYAPRAHCALLAAARRFCGHYHPPVRFCLRVILLAPIFLLPRLTGPCECRAP